MIDDGSIIAKRVFNESFIVFDLIFLTLMVSLLLWRKKYTTLLVGLFAGLLYLLVDYCIFYLLFKERKIAINNHLVSDVNAFLILFWMSMSYGFTNFVWIWLWISKDKHLFEWSLIILLWWLCGPMIMSRFNNSTVIETYRTSSTTHGIMAILLFAGYLMLVMWNLFHNKEYRVNILWLLYMGILVQLGWELGLLLGGIRSNGRTLEQKLMTLFINSLLETNLGMPYIYFIFIAYSAKYNERMKKREKPLSFLQRIAENNAEKVKSSEASQYLLY
ncbi:hypothetical protein [Mycoplasmopsis primatum]|uniref:hypothetical protein n=1 Tax=Mycoplasmopsis primatum TaxID=55604 RepID=UPI00068A1DF0|nr:hypothetical protein [Mycoplasmopsis primatum]